MTYIYIIIYYVITYYNGNFEYHHLFLRVKKILNKIKTFATTHTHFGIISNIFISTQMYDINIYIFMIVITKSILLERLLKLCTSIKFSLLSRVFLGIAFLVCAIIKVPIYETSSDKHNQIDNYTREFYQWEFEIGTRFARVVNREVNDRDGRYTWDYDVLS